MSYTERIGYEVDSGAQTRVLIPSGGRTGKFTDAYTYVFRPAWRRLASDRRLTLVDVRVWFAVQALAPHQETEWDSAITRVCELVGTDERRAYRALETLTRFGYIERPKRGKVAHNPKLTWRGKAADRERLVAATRLPEPAENREASPQKED